MRTNFELRVLRIIEGAGLPAPLVNHDLVLDGRRVIPDFLWPEIRLVVEADHHATHSSPVAVSNDELKDRLYRRNGYHLVRVRDGQTDAEIAAAITAAYASARSRSTNVASIPSTSAAISPT